jgi:hypothetical protein
VTTTSSTFGAGSAGGGSGACALAVVGITIHAAASATAPHRKSCWRTGGFTRSECWLITRPPRPASGVVVRNPYCASLSSRHAHHLPRVRRPARQGSFFRYQSGSGPSELTGWILVLFPYLKLWGDDWQAPPTIRPTPYLARWEAAYATAEAGTSWIKNVEGPGLASIPTSLASAPVVLVDVRDGRNHPCVVHDPAKT